MSYVVPSMSWHTGDPLTQPTDPASIEATDANCCELDVILKRNDLFEKQLNRILKSQLLDVNRLLDRNSRSVQGLIAEEMSILVGETELLRAENANLRRELASKRGWRIPPVDPEDSVCTDRDGPKGPHLDVNDLVCSQAGDVDSNSHVQDVAFEPVVFRGQSNETITTTFSDARPAQEGELRSSNASWSRYSVSSPSGTKVNPVLAGMQRLMPMWVPQRSETLPNRCRSSTRMRQSVVAKDAGKAVFVDATLMKEQVRQAISSKAEYDVTVFYWDTGIAQSIARDSRLELATQLTIMANVIWIMIDADYNTHRVITEVAWYFQLADNFFCAFFFVEIVIRFAAFERKCQALMDMWFDFDAVLVMLMIMETWVMPALAAMTSLRSSDMTDADIVKMTYLLRLTRMARMARLLRTFPELMGMVKGLAHAARSVCLTLFLLFIVIYVFAVTFKELTMRTPIGDKYFRTVPQAFLTLLLYGALIEDSPAVVLDVGGQHVALGFLFFGFMLLAAIVIMNMLVGVLVNVVNAVSSVETERTTVSFIKAKMQAMFLDCGLLHDNYISKREFEEMLTTPQASVALSEVGVDVITLVDFADSIFAGDTELTFCEFMEAVLSFRGSNLATVSDIVHLRKVLYDLSQKLVRIENCCDAASHNWRHLHDQESQPPDLKWNCDSQMNV
eukprot:TRINITY_DN15769_c0_g3_i1.p1 TRINITY_DN15769_c0_g3~~TRINITY_DN15769_c0_g3_i1.p1  ORF type:complete len:691 (-),score=113.36 TRINITY_DN15769_c0_g3_i1:195-2222(-)